jgi:spermidine/putrescine transport system ATP-binding protein
MGAPEELYDRPRTTFVANFLGRSNLIAGDVVGSGGAGLVVEVAGARIAAEPSRAAVADGRVWVGVRPEKVFLAGGSAAPEPGVNALSGGVVSDVGFVGVSTEYLVRMPWGQELSVFEQNTGARPRFAPGSPVELRWQPAHTFLLDHDQDARAGVETVAPPDR